MNSIFLPGVLYFMQILLSVRDANDELVTLSLNAIAFLVPILGGDIIVGSERPRLFYEGIPKVGECLIRTKFDDK